MGSYNAYVIDNEIYVSVSTILAQEGAPALVPWALRKFGNQEPSAMQAYDAFMKDVSAQGTLIHKFIEHDLKGLEFPENEITPALVPVVENYYKFKAENKIEMLESEVQCHSKKYRIAGTCDFVGRVNGELYIVDFKTGSVQDKALSQLAAYKSFLIEMGRDDLKDAKLAILNLHRDGEKVQFVTNESLFGDRVDDNDHLRLFHALRFVWYIRNVKSRKWQPVIKNWQDLISPLEAKFMKAFKF